MLAAVPCQLETLYNRGHGTTARVVDNFVPSNFNVTTMGSGLYQGYIRQVQLGILGSGSA